MSRSTRLVIVVDNALKTSDWNQFTHCKGIKIKTAMDEKQCEND